MKISFILFLGLFTSVLTAWDEKLREQEYKELEEMFCTVDYKEFVRIFNTKTWFFTKEDKDILIKSLSLFCENYIKDLQTVFSHEEDYQEDLNKIDYFQTNLEDFFESLISNQDEPYDDPD
ncbi:MAG: hypothetical protein AB7R69_04290 [Candidatus Babeliales bacterium]